ncbi:junction-mediating and -regulatory protein-like [Grus japonensis]|uniref:Junction-mediating and -regulatory protein-like n=1 Tax=Grus japonensis TaxID=30415 RepID=A0ABC9W7Y5_GRUJA
MPAGSKTDPSLAKAEPISSGGSASGVTQLRRGKNGCAAAARERSDLSIDCALPLLHQSDPSTDKTILVKREEEELERDENEELEATEDEDDCG